DRKANPKQIHEVRLDRHEHAARAGQPWQTATIAPKESGDSEQDEWPDLARLQDEQRRYISEGQRPRDPTSIRRAAILAPEPVSPILDKIVGRQNRAIVEKSRSNEDGDAQAGDQNGHLKDETRTAVGNWLSRH